MSQFTHPINELAPEHHSYILVSSEDKYDEFCRNKKLVKTLKKIGWGGNQGQSNNPPSITQNVVSSGFNEPLFSENLDNSESDTTLNSILSKSKKIANSTYLSVNNATSDLKDTLQR